MQVNKVSKCWCFTLNNYNELEWLGLAEIECSYICYQKEVGENLTPHIQGYIRFNRNKKLSGAKQIIPRAHWEVAKGTFDQNRAYCSKEGGTEFTERGDAPKQGNRRDLDDFVADIKKGSTISELIDAHGVSVLKFNKGMTFLMNSLQPPRDFKTSVNWYWGPTGTGKSRAANLEAGPSAYYKMGGNKWWDGYDGHQHVIVDDFRRDLAPFHELLKLFDQYPHRVEVKGGSMQFLARTIWITCNKSPQDCFVGEDGGPREDIGQMLRRITCIKYFGERYVESDV